MTEKALQHLMGTAHTDSSFREDLFDCARLMDALGRKNFQLSLTPDEIEIVFEASQVATGLEEPERLARFAQFLTSKLDLVLPDRPKV